MASSETRRLRETLKRLIAFAGGLFLLGILFTAIEYKFNSTGEQFEVNIEPVDGKFFVKKEDIADLIKKKFYGETTRSIEDLLGDETLKRINLKSLEEVVDNFPWVLESDVFVDAQNNITIDIIQREPIMRCFDAKNNSFYIDEHGVEMPISENATSRVIVASGNIAEPRVGIEGDTLYNVVDSLFKLVEFIRQDTFLTAQIEQIYVEKNQDFTLIPKVGDTELIFGDLTFMEEKFRKLKIFYLEAMPYEGWRKYNKLNLKFKNQVVGVKN